MGLERPSLLVDEEETEDEKRKDEFVSVTKLQGKQK